MSDTFRIGAGAGYSGDRIDPAQALAEHGRLHALVFECLAERTIALAQLRRSREPEHGYDPLLEARWRAVLDKWRIQTILTERTSALAQALAAVGGWRLVFTEREAAVFVREADEHRALLARLPSRSLAVPWPDVVEPLLAGLAAAEAGDDERAVRHYREALRRFPDHPLVISPVSGDLQIAYLLPKDRYGKGLYQEEPSILGEGCLEGLIEAIDECVQELAK